MPLSRIWNNHKPTLSFEFYPAHSPKAQENLRKAAHKLLALRPDFVSVTFGAGGSTREGSRDLIAHLASQGEIPVVGYLASWGLSAGELEELALSWQQIGASAIFCIRGDIPAENPCPPHPEGFSHASELIAFLRDKVALPLGAAAYPEGHVQSSRRETDWDYLIHKARQGAQFIITQYFYDNADFHTFREYCRTRGMNQPILAGIMPIYHPTLPLTLAEKCGANIPIHLREELAHLDPEDRPALNTWGVNLALAQCRDLLTNGVDGLHFYTMDRSLSVLPIVTTLREEGLL